MKTAVDQTTDQILDNILVPRSNGSDSLVVVGNYLKQFLSESGAHVSTHTFTGTPYGFQLVWAVVLVMMLVYVCSIYKRTYLLALVMCTLTPLILLAEFEFLRSPISGMAPLEQQNIIGSYSGSSSDTTLIFTAHYDTATHFGDHFDWGFWGSMQGPAQGVAFLLVSMGLYLKRKGRLLSNIIAVPLALVATVPFAAMFWFQTIGPLVRTPSPGAIDNGGSMAAMLLLAKKLEYRDPGAPTSVKLVFLAAEEERALGSWAYAQQLAETEQADQLKVVNLESIGASDAMAYIAEDGFATRRFRSSPAIIEYVNAAALEAGMEPLEERSIPFGTLTDGRSFLAHGLEAITLRSYEGDSFPRRLHSPHDSRDRLLVSSVRDGAEFLWSIVQYSDSHAHQQP